MTQSGGAHGGSAENTTVFLSYSRIDQAKALPIIDAIEAAGYRVWWDGMLEGGTSFLETTEQALESAKAVVVLWSKTSVRSHWVRDEATSGRVRERLIPLTLDGTIAPLGFRQVQLIDFQNWDGGQDTPNMAELTRMLAVMHGKTVPPLTGTPHIPLQTKTLSRRNVVLGVSALGVAGLTSLAVTGKMPLRRTSLLVNGIAVLPFKNLSGDAAHNYISTGLSSEIRTTLARNEALRVVSRSSAEAVAQEGLDAKSIARRLSVANILEGSIRKVGKHINITVELIDGHSGFNKWTASFQHAEENALEVHNKIAETLIQELSYDDFVSRFDPQSGDTQNAAAFSEYLKGATLFRSNVSREDNLKALEHFNTALNKDANFGAALATKARLLLWLSATSPDSAMGQTYRAEAIAAAKKAVETSPKMPNAYTTLGYILFGQLDVAGAKIPYEKAQSAGMTEAPDFALYASYMAATGEDAKAMEAITRALLLDPLNPTIHRTHAFIHYAGRRYEKAIQASETILEINPDHYNVNMRLGLSYIALGDIETGLSACEAERNDLEKLTCLSIGNYKLGNETAAKGYFDQLVTQFGDGAAYQQAQILAASGQHLAAFEALNLAVELGDSGLTLLLIDPFFYAMRSKPGFQDLLDKLGFSANR